MSEMETFTDLIDLPSGQSRLADAVAFNHSPSTNGLALVILRHLLAWASWGLLCATICQWILVCWLGDVWWLGTVVLFAPRWPLLIPQVVVAVLCLVWRRRLLWINLATAVLLVGPLMGLCVPLSRSGTGANDIPIRVLTANLGDGVHIDLLRAQIRTANPDIITFQESPSQLLDGLTDMGWHWKSARGLLVGSRFPILETNVLQGSLVGRYHDNGLRARIHTPAGDVWICCINLDSPRSGFESLMVTRRGIFGEAEFYKNLEHRSELSGLASRWVSELDGPTIVAGDMNQPAESYFFRRDWSSWRDAYATAGVGYGHTWFSRSHGVRIDHILADKRWRVADCHVAGDTGGDHRPLVADVSL